MAKAFAKRLISRSMKLLDLKTFFALGSRTHRRVALLSSSLICLVLLVQNPAVIFAGNVKEFTLNTIDYFSFLIPAYIVCTVILFLPAFLLQKRILAGYALITSFLALLVWAYSNLIVIDFGVLDGGKFDFSIVDDFLPLEALGALAAFLVLVWAFARFGSAVSRSLLVLNLLVGATVLVQLSMNYQSGRKFTEVDNRSIYRVSDTKNVLIILMDQFQSDIFADLVQNRPDVREELEGFTFFPDALGVGPTTRLTMPSVHSGEFYETGPKLNDYYKTRVERGSFLNSLSDAGHEVTLVAPPSLGCPVKAALCKAVWSTVFRRNDLLTRELAKLLDLSMFRASPLAGKETFYNNGDWLLSKQRMKAQHFVVVGNTFLNRFASTVTVDGSKPATKFIHIMSTHRPYVVNQHCRFTGNNRTAGRRTLMYNQASCGLDSFVSVLRKLKAIGAYDQTTIMLIADTGVGAFNVGSSHGSSEGEVSYHGSGLYGAANPVLLVKPMHARGDYAISDNQVQLTDVAATICELTSDCNGFPGKSVYNQNDDQRLRQYNLYHLTTDWSDKDFVPKPDAYEIKGPLWRLSSWPDALRPGMRVGVPIKLDHEEHNAVYLGEGWGPIKAEGTFTYAAEATMYFYPEENLAEAYEFTVSAENTFAGRDQKSGIVEVYANGQLIGSWDYSGVRQTVENSVVIPKTVIGGSELLEIKFKMKAATSWVVERKTVRHVRVRGIRVKSVQFDVAG